MIKTEWKVKAAAWATFLAATAGLSLLTGTVTDLVPVLPDWAESPAYGLVLAGITWLTGYATKTRPSGVSDSTIKAVQEYLAKRAGALAPRTLGGGE